MISIKSEREIELMRETSKLAAETLKYIKPFVKPGVSTEEINQLCHDYIIKNNAIPAPLNYHGFPKSVCTSLNQVICHGIPNEKDILKDGDILNIDVTTILNGFHGDTNKTYFVGNKVNSKVKKLVYTAYDCMMAGIREVKPGARLGTIGATISKLAHKYNFSVVREYCGHGIGRNFHEDPQVLHYGRPNTGVELKSGMTFTIEPMINIGKRHCKLLSDGWTVVTQDRSLSAQFEHTILVTDDGYEILTALEGDEFAHLL